MDRNTQPINTGQLFPLPTDKAEIARIEARNALRQFDAAMEMVDAGISANAFQLRPSNLFELNFLATDGVDADCGTYRRSAVEIVGSQHTPPGPKDVPRLTEELCDYVNQNWSRTPVHLAAYLMWRVNWVHPFGNGNGRTSRMIAYVVLCIRLSFRLPGANTIPEQISRDKQPYYIALEAADAAYTNNVIDVSAMEDLLGKLLAVQLLGIHDDATGH